MNKKVKNVLEPNMQLYFIMLIVFAVATFFWRDNFNYLAYAEVGIIVFLFIYSKITNRRRRNEILKYIEEITYNRDNASRSSLATFPLPMVIFNLNDGRIISANDNFLNMTGDHDRFFEFRITDSVPDFPVKWLAEGKSECPEIITVRGKKYVVYGNVFRTENSSGKSSYIATTYWVDVTHYEDVSEEYENSRLNFAILMLDNYDELLNGLSTKERTALLSAIDDVVTDWTSEFDGYLVQYDRDRYIFLFEERYMQRIIDNKFPILDSARKILSPKGIAATISIGIGRDGRSISENAQFASLGIEMSLSRGGDQAVIKNRFSFEFYGGHSTEVEKHTKVKARVMANSLKELISEASSIFVMGHKFADLDAVGAAVGICCIARKVGKNARIVLDLENNASQKLIDRLVALPEYENAFISTQDAMLEADGQSLLVVVDTNRPEQVESEELLLSCNHVAVIDHHRRAATYIQNAVLNFHEPYASSASELVTELLQYIVDQSDILRFEAEALLSGIMLDTKNFTLRTGGRTFDAAAFLRRAGADTTEVKKFLQSDIKTAVAKYSIIQKAKMYKDGIAISASETPQNRVIAAQAADELLNIAGIQASFVVFPENDKISISARSIGDVNVQYIVEKLGGGGNKSTAGAQIAGKTEKEVITALLTAIDDYLKNE